jgi:DNA-binding transcriptional ArsR family regulator
MFQALSDPTRCHIVEMLAAQGQMSAGEIVKKFDVSAPAISQHLKVLKAAQLVSVEVKAQSRIYRINRDGFADAQDWIARMTASLSESFDKLDALLENEDPRRKP